MLGYQVGMARRRTHSCSPSSALARFRGIRSWTDEIIPGRQARKTLLVVDGNTIEDKK